MQNDSDMKFTKKLFIKDVGRLGPRKIESNQFSTLDQSEIIKADKAQVYKAACCDRYVGKPHKAGLVDRLVQEHLCIHKNGETQDFITSFFHITRKDTFYHRAAFFLMCSYMGDSMDYVDLPAPAIIKPIELWSGKQLFSVLVRPNAGVRIYLNFTVEEKNYNKIKKNDRYTETMCPNDGFVFFCNSDLICGQLGKATLGNCNKNGLYSVLLRDYNAHAAACMNRLAMFSARQLGNHVFSIGIDDFKASKKLNQESQKINSDSCKKCDDHIKSYNS